MGKNRMLSLVLGAALCACGGGKNGMSASASVDVGSRGAGANAEAMTTSPKNASAIQSTPAPPPVTVSFGKGAPAAGTSRTVRLWIGRKALFSVDKAGTPFTEEHVSGELDERREDIMTAVNGASTQLKVTFLHKESTIVDNGNERTRKAVVAGKAYLVASKDGSLYITTDQGRRVSQAEGDLIAQGYGDLGQPDALYTGVPGGSLAVGQSEGSVLAGVEGAILRGAQGHVGFGQGSATLRSTRSVGGQSCGVFAVQLPVVYKLEKVEARADMSGELVVRTSDSVPVSLSLQGPVIMSGQTARADIEGQGDARIELSIQ